MMERPVVAVAAELTPVRRRLEERGYRVVSLEEAFDGSGDPLAVVVSGVDDDVTGVASVRVKAPVISAAGKTAEEVAADVDRARDLARRG